jgi:hypothetical protein
MNADRLEIHDVVMRYCQGVDRRRPELIRNSFHPDATIRTGDGTFTPEQLVDRSMNVAAKVLTHFVGNELVELHGDRAYSETYVLAFQVVDRDGGPATRTRALRYCDLFERRDGSWRIAERVFVDEWSRIDPIVETATEPHAELAEAAEHLRSQLTTGEERDRG